MNTISFSRRHVKNHIYSPISNTLQAWVDLQKYILDLDSSSECLQYPERGAFVSFMRNAMKDPHIQSITVFEWVKNKVSFWVYDLHEQRQFYKIRIFLTSWHKSELNMNYFFLYIINCLGHKKKKKPKLLIFVFFNFSLQVLLLFKSLQLMLMILPMGTVLKLSTAFSRDNHISLSNLRQVRGPYLSFCDNVCNSKWHAKPS